MMSDAPCRWALRKVKIWWSFLHAESHDRVPDQPSDSYRHRSGLLDDCFFVPR